MPNKIPYVDHHLECWKRLQCGITPRSPHDTSFRPHWQTVPSQPVVEIKLELTQISAVQQRVPGYDLYSRPH